MTSKGPIAGLTYLLKSSIYVSLTNRCNAVSLIESRGPSFTMPAASGFERLPPNLEPTAEQVADAVTMALLTKAEVTEVCFAGAGEPLLKRRLIEEACNLISQKHGGRLKLRINTNGLVPKSEVTDVAAGLRACGVSAASVALASADAAQYAALMQPEPMRLTPAFSLPLGLDEVKGFVSACVAAGLAVECNAVARPEVDVCAVAALAEGLGASFRERSWHP